MTHIKTIGKYIIESEKVDKVGPWWGDICAYIGLFICGGTGIVSFLLASTPFGAFLLFISIIFFGFSMWIPNKYLKCGVCVSLWVHGVEKLRSETFQLTEDPDLDSLKVKEIVKKYEDVANKFLKYEKDKMDLKASQEKQCCDAYRKVINEVLK